MVVNVFVNVVSAENIKGLCKRKMSWNALIPIARHKACCMENSVKVNDRCELCSISLALLPIFQCLHPENYPHVSTIAQVPRGMCWLHV